MTNIPSTPQHRIARIDHGVRSRTKGVVIHVMAGTLAGTLDWWAKSGHEADGAHLCIGIGKVVQTADLNAICWHAPGDNSKMPGTQDGNHEWVGFEHEGGGSDPRRVWVFRRKQRIMSANRCAWVLYHFDLGEPEWNKNVAEHSDFPEGGHPCPGPGFPKDLYIKAAQRAHKNLVRSKGKRWTRTPRPKIFSR